MQEFIDKLKDVELEGIEEIISSVLERPSQAKSFLIMVRTELVMRRK